MCFSKPQLGGVKVKTREPDIIKEMKRGNMREKWGLHMLYRVYNGRLELCVKKGDVLKMERFFI